MSTEKTELERMEVLRLSNIESNRITKECIESALILLMKEREYTDISITDIVKRAGVSRTAYYRNYSSKEDILHNMMQEVVDKVVAAMNLYAPTENAYNFWYAMFHALNPYYETYQLLLKANFGETILYEINQKLLSEVSVENIIERYTSNFWSGAVYSILTEWIKNGRQQTEEEMAHICCSILQTFAFQNE